jgi:hypothetical protein
MVSTQVSSRCDHTIPASRQASKGNSPRPCAEE